MIDSLKKNIDTGLFGTPLYEMELHHELTGPCIIRTSIMKNEFTITNYNNHDEWVPVLNIF